MPTSSHLQGAPHQGPAGLASRVGCWSQWATRTKAVTSGSEDARAGILRFGQTMVQGNLPHFLDARLPLAKPSGGVRTTAIGEAWYRLAALRALTGCPHIGSCLAALQVAVGTAGGSQAHSVSMVANPCFVTVLVDKQNAFSNLRQDKRLAAVEQRYPPLPLMVAWAYSRISHLLIHQPPDGVVNSQSGLWQGDPLGPLHFARILQGNSKP
jgi:hypothetical protein